MQLEQCKHLVFDAIPEESRAFAYELLRRAVAFGALRPSSGSGELLKASGHLARPFTFSFLDVSATSVLVRRRRIIETCGRRNPFNDYHLITRTRLGARVITVPRSVVVLNAKKGAVPGGLVRSIQRDIKKGNRVAA